MSEKLAGFLEYLWLHKESLGIKMKPKTIIAVATACEWFTLSLFITGYHFWKPLIYAAVVFHVLALCLTVSWKYLLEEEED